MIYVSYKFLVNSIKIPANFSPKVRLARKNFFITKILASFEGFTRSGMRYQSLLPVPASSPTLIRYIQGTYTDLPEMGKKWVKCLPKYTSFPRAFTKFQTQIIPGDDKKTVEN